MAASRSDLLLIGATGLAAIAAVFSAFAAFRQEAATYQSVLYNRQVDAVAAFSLAVNQALDKSDELLEKIKGTESEVQTTVRADLRKDGVKQSADLAKAVDVFTLVFPLDEFCPLTDASRDALSDTTYLIDTLDDSPVHPHAKYDSPDQAVSILGGRSRKAAECARSALSRLIECSKQRLRAGQVVRSDFAQGCAYSLSKLKDIASSDAAECFKGCPDR
jgi:hypothetical protein